MGLLSFIKGWRKEKESESLPQFSGQPFSTAGTQSRVLTADEAWQTDTVQQAVARIIAELIKYEPVHVKREEFGQLYETHSQLQKVLDVPNAWNTGSDLLESLYQSYFYSGNAFIVPIFAETPTGSRVYSELYTIKPTIAEHVEDNNGHEGYYFQFASGYEVVLPASDVIHLKRDFGKNEFFGGGKSGRPDTQSLQKLATLDQKLLSGVSRAIDAGYQVRGILKIGSVLDEKKIQKSLDDFYTRLKASDGAVLPLDAKSEYQPITQDIKAVDVETLNFVDERILRSFGVSKAILSGDYTQEQQRAFRATAVEPVIQKLEKELTKKLFTPKERSHGHIIKFYTGELKYIDQTTGTILAMAQAGGILLVNELRSELGYRPLKELATDEQGHPLMMMSKNFGSVDAVKDQVKIEANNVETQQSESQSTEEAGYDTNQNKDSTSKEKKEKEK